MKKIIMDKELIKCLAIDNDWEIVFEHEFPQTPFLRFKKKKTMLDVWYTTGTIRITRPHEKAVYKRYLKSKEIEHAITTL